MLKQLKNRKQEGFTIIEVLIVLAIAGLILLIVFLAVPALQRNSRNTQRKNDAAHLSGLIGEYISNSTGSAPSKVDFSGTPATGELDATTEKFSIIDTTANLTLATLPSPVPSPPAADTAVIYTKATCSGTVPVAGTSVRQIVVWYGLEGSTKSGCITAG